MAGYIKDLEEFAFFNQQLAGMLDAGVPLEGALDRLTRDMKKGHLKRVFTQIKERLKLGEPFGEVIGNFKNKLPRLYYQLCIIGERSENLPSVLTTLASYYRWQGRLKGRLKTLMFYPMILMAAAIGVSFFLAFLLPDMLAELGEDFYETMPRRFSLLMQLPYYYLAALITMFILYLLAVYTPCLKFFTDYLAWRLKVGRYLQLANLSRMLAVLLGAGVPFSRAISLLKQVSSNRITRKSLVKLEKETESGKEITEAFDSVSTFPQVFVWALKNSGEQLPEGFRHNAEMYGRRSEQHLDMYIYAAMPFAIVVIGGLVLGNLAIIFKAMEPLIEMLQIM